MDEKIYTYVGKSFGNPDRKSTLRNGVRIHIYYKMSSRIWAGYYHIPDEISPHREGKCGEVYHKERLKIPGLIRYEVTLYLNPKMREVQERMGTDEDV